MTVLLHITRRLGQSELSKLLPSVLTLEGARSPRVHAERTRAVARQLRQGNEQLRSEGDERWRGTGRPPHGSRRTPGLPARTTVCRLAPLLRTPVPSLMGSAPALQPLRAGACGFDGRSLGPSPPGSRPSAASGRARARFAGCPGWGANLSRRRNSDGFVSQKPSRRNPWGLRLFRPCFRGFAARVVLGLAAVLADQRVPAPTLLRRRGQVLGLLSVLRGERNRERSTGPAKRSPAALGVLEHEALRGVRRLHPLGGQRERRRGARDESVFVARSSSNSSRLKYSVAKSMKARTRGEGCRF